MATTNRTDRLTRVSIGIAMLTVLLVAAPGYGGSEGFLPTEVWARVTHEDGRFRTSVMVRADGLLIAEHNEQGIESATTVVDTVQLDQESALDFINHFYAARFFSLDSHYGRSNPGLESGQRMGVRYDDDRVYPVRISLSSGGSYTLELHEAAREHKVRLQWPWLSAPRALDLAIDSFRELADAYVADSD